MKFEYTTEFTEWDAAVEGSYLNGAGGTNEAPNPRGLLGVYLDALIVLYGNGRWKEEKEPNAASQRAPRP